MFFLIKFVFFAFLFCHFSSAVEQLTRNEQVVGSNPVSGSTNYLETMSYHTYVLFSPSSYKYYVGQCNDSVERAVSQHNAGMRILTKSGIPWQLEYSKNFDNSCDSYLLMKKLQNLKSLQFMRFYIEHLKKNDML